MSQFEWAEDDFDLPAGAVHFGPSESQPAEGRTYVMYHGTTRANARSIMASGFRQSSDGMLGPGVYLSRDLQKASRYPIDCHESDKAVIKVSVNVGKVIAINYQGHPCQKTWHYHGYDTAWVPPNCGMVKSGLEEDCVWDPKRIKIISVINPTPVRGAACDERPSVETTTNMTQFEWAEDDFDLPAGAVHFGPSESQPAEGRTYVMYHGTTRANARSIMASGFRQSSDGMLGPGVYLSRDLQKASRYPIDCHESDKAVIKVSVNVGKVIAINRQGHPCQKTWHDYGYDTAWVPPNCGMVKSGLEEDCVWDPKRIKIINVINPTPVRGAACDERPSVSLSEVMAPTCSFNPNPMCPYCGNCHPYFNGGCLTHRPCFHCGKWQLFYNGQCQGHGLHGNWHPFYWH